VKIIRDFNDRELRESRLTSDYTSKTSKNRSVNYIKNTSRIKKGLPPKTAQKIAKSAENFISQQNY